MFVSCDWLIAALWIVHCIGVLTLSYVKNLENADLVACKKECFTSERRKLLGPHSKIGHL
jgi:hypothetical protein